MLWGANGPRATGHMKIVLDITRLVEEGELTPSEADRLKKLAARETGSLGINILMSVGVIAIGLGILAFEPSAQTAIALGVVLVGAGLAVQHYRAAQWGPLGTANILVGTLAVAGGTLYLADGHVLAFLFVALLLLGLGAVARSGLLIGLAPFALASVLGSSTGYWHASYMLVVREATITILVFAAVAWGVFYLSKQLPSAYERLALIFSRVSLIFVNFGFWIGSLWGDYPGESWARSRIFEDPGTFYERFNELTTWRETALFIPDVSFAVLWALGLLAIGAWGVKRNRRFVVNVAAVFGGIHFYTQWFEHLGAMPWTILIAGIVTVGISVALWKYNRVVLEKAAAAP